MYSDNNPYNKCCGGNKPGHNSLLRSLPLIQWCKWSKSHLQKAFRAYIINEIIFLTVVAYHCLPRDVGMLRLFNSLAMAARLKPCSLSFSIIGLTAARCCAALALTRSQTRCAGATGRPFLFIQKLIQSSIANLTAPTQSGSKLSGHFVVELYFIPVRYA